MSQTASRTTSQRPLVEMKAERAPAPGYAARAGSLLDDAPAPAARPAPATPALREKVAGFLHSGGSRILLIVFVVGAVAFGAFRFYGEAAGPGPQRPRTRIMNPATGELRWYVSTAGGKLPEGFYPVEYCFNNDCGPAGGTPVVLNVRLGKNEPTKCPKCGHGVVGHNPRPEEYLTAVPRDWSR